MIDRSDGWWEDKFDEVITTYCDADFYDALKFAQRKIAQLESALATERAAREEAERLAVWAVIKGALIHAEKLTWMRDIDEANDDDEYRIGSTECDSTDAGILAALRRAMEGEK